MSIPPKVGRKINGNSSSETLLGTAFNDTIFGAAGNDIIRGLAGDDVIRGGLGNDTLTGGPGNNIFTFEKTRAENGLDTITDLGYNRAGRDCGGSDILDFSLAITVKKMTQAAIGNYIKVTTDKVFVDLDGTGPAGWVAWANVSGLAVGDKIKVRTAGFNGFVTVGDGAAPVFAEGQTSFSYDENQSAGATVATVTGFTDDVGVTAYRFSNSGGTSGGTTTGDGWFTIGSGGAITMTGSGAASEANDYEAGSAQSRTYYVQARDAAGNWSAPVAISLNELDVQEVVPDVTAPVYGSGSSSFNYDENQSAGATIGTVTGFTDNVGVTDYRFVDGSGNVAGSGGTTGDGWFTISSGGVITITGSGAGSEANDYEAGSGQSHSYYVQARDAAGNWSAPVAITLNESNVDDTAPVFGEDSTTFSYNENQSAGAQVGSVGGSGGFTDDVGVTEYRFSDSGGTSGGATTGDGWFTISSGGVITITGSGAGSEANDYEAGSGQSHSYYVQARDAAGNWSAPVAITLNESNVDDTAPVFGEDSTTFSYNENQSAGAQVGSVGGSGGFTDDVGVTEYRFSDSGGTSGGATTGDGWFTISSGGVITITGSGAGSEANDYEAGSGQSHSYYVQARDAAGNWSAPVAITLNEADVDDTAPVYGSGSSSFSYNENQSAGAQVGSVGGSGGFTDDVGVTEYRFSDSAGTSGGATTGDGWFTISSGGVITITGSGAGSEANDYEAGSGQSHSYYVQARDAAGNWSAPVAITLNESNVDDTAPVFGEDSTTFSYNENQSAGAQVGSVGGSGGFTDDVGVTEYRFSDSGGTSGGATTGDGWFTISSGGVITITGSGAGSEANDYEAGSGQSHSYYVQARDAAGNWSAPVAITLNEADVDDTAPVYGSGSSSFSYNENQSAGAQVGSVGGSGGFTDDVGVTEYRFSDSAGTSGGATSGDGWFAISSSGGITMTGSGAASEANNYEAGSGQSHSYYVQARDAAGNWSAPVAVTLNELDVNEGSGGPPAYHMYVDRSGVWIDSDDDGMFSAGFDTRLVMNNESIWTLETGLSGGDIQSGGNNDPTAWAGSGYGWSPTGHYFALEQIMDGSGAPLVDFDTGVWTITFRDAGSPTIDISGFGADDKIEIDLAFNTSNAGTNPTGNLFMGIPHTLSFTGSPTRVYNGGPSYVFAMPSGGGVLAGDVFMTNQFANGFAVLPPIGSRQLQWIGNFALVTKAGMPFAPLPHSQISGAVPNGSNGRFAQWSIGTSIGLNQISYILPTFTIA